MGWVVSAATAFTSSASLGEPNECVKYFRYSNLFNSFIRFPHSYTRLHRPTHNLFAGITTLNTHQLRLLLTANLLHALSCNKPGNMLQQEKSVLVRQNVGLNSYRSILLTEVI